MRLRVLALVLLLGLTGLTSLPAQVVPSPLEITSVTLDDGRPRFVGGDPIEQTVTVVVTNTGDRASTSYEIVYEWESDEPESRMPLDGTEFASTDAGTPLLPEESFSHELSWTPRQEQLGEGRILITLVEGGTRYRHPPIEVFVEDHRFALAPESMDPLTIVPDETIHIPVTVSNTGNVEQTLAWEVTRIHSRLQASFQPRGPHPVGESPAVLVVTYPFQGSNEDVIDLTIDARATTPDGLIRFVRTPEIDILHGDEPPPPALSLVGPASSIFAEAGETVDVPFILSNTGGAPDTYTFSRTATNGWSAGLPTVDGQTVDRLSLAAGQSEEVLVAVTPGEDAGRVAGLSLTATSEGGVTDTADADLVLAGVLPVITSVSFLGSPLYVDDPARVRVTYQNAGNAVMEDATLTVRVQYAPGGSESRTLALDDLGPGLGRGVTLDLGTARGAGTASLTATLTAGEEQATETSSDFVRSGVLTVTAPGPVIGTPSERVRYHTPPHAFQVRNDGNAREDVDVKVEGADLLGANSFTLDPGQLRTVAVTQVVPADVGDARTIPVTLTATLGDAPDRSAAATVHTPVQDDAAPTLAWVEAPETMLPSDAGPLRVRADDDTFVVRAWVHVAPLDPDAPDGSDWNVELSQADEWIGLLRSGLPGGYELTPHAEDAFGNVGAGPTRTLQVTPLPPPPAPGPVTIDDVAYHNGTLTVRTNASSLTLVVDGEETRHDVTDGLLELDLPLDGGRHLIEVVAEDHDGTLVERNTTVEIPVAPEEPGLLARLVPGPGVAFVLVALAGLAGWNRRRPHG